MNQLNKKYPAPEKELEKFMKEEVDEGYYEMPSIDRERYTEMPGLEGPFQTMSGKPIYYDPKEGAYYDRDTDMYLTYDEFKALDEAMTDKEVNDFHNALDKVVHKHIGHSSDEDEEKERLTKKIDEMPIPKSTMYGLVIDGKYVAKGSKRAMVAMKKNKGGEVYNALEKGVIDAADLSDYVANKSLGLHKVAKYALVDFHSMPVLSFTVNKKKWNSQPKDIQAILTMAARDMGTQINMRQLMLRGPAEKDDLENHGVTIINWSDDERKKMRAMAAKIWEIESKKSDFAKLAFDLSLIHI